MQSHGAHSIPAAAWRGSLPPGWTAGSDQSGTLTLIESLWQWFRWQYHHSESVSETYCLRHVRETWAALPVWTVTWTRSASAPFYIPRAGQDSESIMMMRHRDSESDGFRSLLCPAHFPQSTIRAPWRMPVPTQKTARSKLRGQRRKLNPPFVPLLQSRAPW